MAGRIIGLWGDSIGKGVVFDEARGRYAILKENCVHLLSEKLGRSIENHAMMGSTAPQGASRMNDAFLRPGGLAVIEFGGNDCDMPWKEISEAPEKDYQPRVPLKEFSETLTALVQKVRDAGMDAMLVTPPPLHAERYFHWISRGLNADAIHAWLGDIEHIYRWQERYAVAVRDVAMRTGSRLLDLRDAFLDVRTLGDYYCVDGIHPNARGHALLAQAVEQKLGLAL